MITSYQFFKGFRADDVVQCANGIVFTRRSILMSNVILVLGLVWYFISVFVLVEFLGYFFRAISPSAVVMEIRGSFKCSRKFKKKIYHICHKPMVKGPRPRNKFCPNRVLQMNDVCIIMNELDVAKFFVTMQVLQGDGKIDVSSGWP